MSGNDNKVNIFCFDVDNTVVFGYTQKYFINFLYRTKRINILFLIISYVWFVFYRLNVISNLYFPMNFLVGKLRGLDRKEFTDLFDNFFDECINDKIILDMYNNVIKKINRNESILLLLSTSLTPIVERIAGRLGISYYVATNIKFSGDFCSGEIDGPIIDGFEKVNAVENFLNKLGLIRNGVNFYFYTDSHHDLDLLIRADHQIVINPTKKLYNIAKSKNWPINYYTK